MEYIYILKQFWMLCRCSMQLVRCSVVGGFWEHFCKAWNCRMLNSCGTVGNVYSFEKINKHSFSNMISQPDASYWKHSNMKHAMWNVPQNMQLLKNISGKQQ